MRWRGSDDPADITRHALALDVREESWRAQKDEQEQSAQGASSSICPSVSVRLAVSAAKRARLRRMRMAVDVVVKGRDQRERALRAGA